MLRWRETLYWNLLKNWPLSRSDRAESFGNFKNVLDTFEEINFGRKQILYLYCWIKEVVERYDRSYYEAAYKREKERERDRQTEKGKSEFWIFSHSYNIYTFVLDHLIKNYFKIIDPFLYHMTIHLWILFLKNYFDEFSKWVIDIIWNLIKQLLLIVCDNVLQVSRDIIQHLYCYRLFIILL